MKLQYSTDNIRWNTQKKRFKYQKNNRLDEDNDDEGQEEDLYVGMFNISSDWFFYRINDICHHLGLDPDYVEYLKLKRQKEFDDEQAVTAEQRQS